MHQLGSHLAGNLTTPWRILDTRPRCPNSEFPRHAAPEAEAGSLDVH